MICLIGHVITDYFNCSVSIWVSIILFSIYLQHIDNDPLKHFEMAPF